MKKLILTLTIATFALTSATFADEAKKECPMAKKAQCTAGEKKACCAAGKKAACTSEAVSKQAVLAPKAKQ